VGEGLAGADDSVSLGAGDSKTHGGPAEKGFVGAGSMMGFKYP